MPHFAASHLGLFYLPMSHKKDARLIWVKTFLFITKTFCFTQVFGLLHYFHFADSVSTNGGNNRSQSELSVSGIHHVAVFQHRRGTLISVCAAS